MEFLLDDAILPKGDYFDPLCFGVELKRYSEELLGVSSCFLRYRESHTLKIREGKIYLYLLAAYGLES